MKLVCTQNDFSTNLALVSRAVPGRPPQPVLANVRLTANVETQQVSLIAFDLSLGIKTSFPAQIEVGGDMALPAKLLNEIVSRLPAGDITLEETAEETVTLTCAIGRYEVRGMDATDFPQLPVIENSQALLLPKDILLEGLQGCLFATSTDDTKQVLMGVHLKISPDNLEFAATDGHRLAIVKTTNQTTSETESPVSSNNAPFEITIPARALRELEKIAGMQQSDSAIALHLDQAQVVFQLPVAIADGSIAAATYHRITTRTLEGQYPDYHQLIPKEFQRQLSIERQQLLSAVERIAVLADKKNHLVKFNLDSDRQQLTLSVEASDIGAGQESMSAQISGDSLEIVFNVRYLHSVIKAIPSRELQMQLNEAAKPVIFRPLGGERIACMVMPVQIRE